MVEPATEPLLQDAIEGLRRGDFSRLAPLFDDGGSGEGRPCRIVEWCEEGRFAKEPAVLAEALACACFLGRTSVVSYLLARGVDIAAGAGTGLNGYHWAANRGQLDTVRFLIEQNAPLEIRNSYGGTVLGGAVWAAVHEPRPNHPAIIEALIRAGARLDEAAYPSGSERIDALLRRHGAGT